MTTPARVEPLPPRVTGWPVVGALPGLVWDPIGSLRSLSATAALTRVKLGPRDVFFVNHPDLAHEVLVDRTADFVKAGLGKERMRPLGGDGIALADGEVWARARRMINPLFGRKHLRALGAAATGAIGEHLDHWDEPARTGAPIDLSLEVAGLTLSVLAATMFSQSLAPADRRRLGEDWKTVMTWIQARVFTPGLPEWIPMPFARRGRAAMARIEAQLFRMIDERLGAVGAESGPTGSDLLDALVAAHDDGTAFDRTELRDHAVNLMFAGHETTAATLSWALVLLEQHPEWAEQAVAEIDAVLGGAAPDFDDIARLAVTRACWEEGLRIAPPGTVAPRSAARDTSLGGYRVPAGSIVLINYVGAQAHADFWDHPDRYDPGRFLAGDPEVRRRAYLPYGLGPRACVGSLMGQMEGVFAMVMILQRYRLTLAPGGSLKATMRGTIHFREGPRMVVHRRIAAPVPKAGQ